MGVAVMPRADRRGADRHHGGESGTVRGIRLRTGHRAKLVDLSAYGASIETDARLSPGRLVDVVLLLEHTSVAARTTVVHARVCGLHPTLGVRYRIGLRVHQPARGEWPGMDGNSRSHGEYCHG
jgi:hypothetical protein